MKTTRVLLGSMIIASFFSASIGQAATLSPTETVTSAITMVMNILTDPQFRQPGMSEARRAAIEDVVRSSVSYQDMARHSLGIAWSTLSAVEQQNFSNLFVQILRDAVACRMDDYSMTRIIYLSERRDGNLAEVRTSFRGDKVDTAIDVRLVDRSGQWLIYDAVIDDVRVADNYRAQFGHVMVEESYASLVDKIEAQAFLHKNFERILEQ